jgi:hypothetical protein
VKAPNFIGRPERNREDDLVMTILPCTSPDSIAATLARGDEQQRAVDDEPGQALELLGA